MTTIAGRDVPIEPGEIVTVDFTGGRNLDDTGPKDFWTAFNEKSKVTVRWHRGEDPGDRFRMMEGERGYEDTWEIARTSMGIRPATLEEVNEWLRRHPKDAPFAESCQIDGRSLHPVKNAEGFFRFE